MPFTFTLPSTWTRLEIYDTGEGYSGTKNLVLTKSMLDDFFGIGSLGIDEITPAGQCGSAARSS